MDQKELCAQMRERGAIVSVTVRTPDRTDELTNVKDWFHGVGGGYEVVTRKDDET